MGNVSANPVTESDKKLLDTCVSAFEIAIREIRKIENSASSEQWDEKIAINKRIIGSMKAELGKYGTELYRTGYKNGSENLAIYEDEIASEIKKSISNIIDSSVFPDRQ